MAVTAQEKETWEKTLKELELLNEGEEVEEYVKGDYWTLFGQTRGQYLFTNEKMIFVSGFGFETFTAPYKDIKEIKKNNIRFFIPTGIKVTVFDQNKGKEKKYKMSVMKRKEWMKYLSEKSGVSVDI